MVGVSPSTQATVHIDAGKALTLAFDGLDGTSLVVEAAVKTGALHGAPAAAVATDLRHAQAILEAAYTAYHAGTATNINQAISDASDLLADAKKLAGGTP